MLYSPPTNTARASAFTLVASWSYTSCPCTPRSIDTVGKVMVMVLLLVGRCIGNGWGNGSSYGNGRNGNGLGFGIGDGSGTGAGSGNGWGFGSSSDANCGYGNMDGSGNN